MGLFDNRITRDGKTQVPVWFMRQAGRYHAHYQNIRKDHEFMSMCKDPKLAQEITHGPLDEFNFDAAILFSDLLFPLEQMGMGLSYHSGPPTLEVALSTTEDLKSLTPKAPAREFFDFQKQACSLLRSSMPEHKTLLGFVGSPFTLYSYAVEGAHKGNLISSKLGLLDGRYEGFVEILFDNLLSEMCVQAEGGADAVCLFDTACGEVSLETFKTYLLPTIKKLTSAFKKLHPEKKVIYYSKMTNLSYLREIQDDNIDVLGVDWRMNLTEALDELGNDYYIQGNLDPSFLFASWENLEKQWMKVWSQVQESKVGASKWICGLGHGVLPKTPESNVANSVKLIHEKFIY